MDNLILSYINNIDNFETYDLEKLIPVLPLDSIQQSISEFDDYPEDEKVIRGLLKWFKQEFKWVNGAKCSQCNEPCQQLLGSTGPNSEEAKYGAGHTELWMCGNCHKEARFPRYNDAAKILEVKEGRCGEWCNAFTQLLRFFNVIVRQVWNLEDHVWNEVYSTRENRWVHCDSCENMYDHPLLYSDGWGKKMSYCFAGYQGGITNVSNRYIRRDDARLPEPRFNEHELNSKINYANTIIRSKLPRDLATDCIAREDLERAELNSFVPTKIEDLPARQSGSAEWVNSRGEGGN